MSHNIVLNAREKAEDDDVWIHLQMWYHGLVVIRIQYVVGMKLEIDAHVA